MKSEEFVDIEQLNENLNKWFKEKWVRFGPDGKIRGACARGSKGEGKPKCLPQSKAQSLGKKGRKYAGAKKRREDPNANRSGAAKNVATKKKSNESMNEGVPFNECPQCRGPIVHESMMTEKQDACYHKVKSRYKVWPSAYASGALVQCRKKGASNWGTGGKKNENSVMKGLVDEAKAKQYVKPYNDPQTGEQIGWKSSDGYHVKYWQKFAKAKAYQHAKLNPDEVQENYTGQFAAEKTPAINPYGGLKDNKFRGDISEEQLDEACWKGYHKEGNKKMFGKTYPNCVKNKKSNEDIEEDNDRVARKPGQPANSKKHSDLYTDENPKGTITGLKFATPEDARASVSKIRKSGRSHAHKIQAAVAMEQRAKAAGKAEAASIYRKYINATKKTDEGTDLEEACWDTHKQVGMKNKGGRQVPNCVAKESAIMKGLKSL